MSLKNLFLGIGRRLLKGKKESATPTTGKQQKLLTYQGKTPQDTGLQLAKKEMANPPVIRQQTKSLYMGDKTPPAFGSSTYDWAMKMGPGKYTADQWLNHLTSTRTANFKVWGKPVTKKIREQKRFKYDSGPFAGRETSVTKEELFDTNVAIFNEAGDLTGGLLYAAKKFGLRLDANEIGAMIKLNPLNRLKAVELGVTPQAWNNFFTLTKSASKELDDMAAKYTKIAGNEYRSIADNLTEASYQLKGLDADNLSKSAIQKIMKNFNENITYAKQAKTYASDYKKINKIMGEVDNAFVKTGGKNVRTQYGDESSYTLQGGTNYRETIFKLDEAIPSNQSPFRSPSHFSEHGKNQIYHVRFDTRYTPDGKKAFLIHEVQSDANQSIAKALSKAQQLGGENRVNPFQADLEMKLLIANRSDLVKEMTKEINRNNSVGAQRVAKELADINRKLKNTFSRARDGDGKRYDYFPMVEADQYGDHALKYLMNKAAKEGVDYVAVAPFEKLSFRQGYKAGNERFYGYASGKGIDKKGQAVMPNVMKKAAKFYDSKAEPVKLSLSDPKKPYKKVEYNSFEYPSTHALAKKKIKSIYHEEAYKVQQPGSRFIEEGNPNLYFDAFAVKVNPLMKYTQKTYKAQGGLVVDMFKPIRYNESWL
jgi:hypothetical protein